MSQIKVTNLTFSYDGSPDDVFNDATFSIDTDWKLGLIGRNGEGKTTLLNLLMGRYDYSGSIKADSSFDYFPYQVSEPDLTRVAADLIGKWKPQIELWQVLIQMNELQMNPECLYRPFRTLSFGERTRVMLAVLFATDNEFLLIDEPTNHLSSGARDIVKAYLASKKGFILVSHDRDLLDDVCDHVLVLNRSTLEVQAGNFSTWWENKEKKDAFLKAENEKHLKEIGKLKNAADRNSRWADKNESTKIGFDPIKEHDRSIAARSFIGAKTKKMQARVKSYEKRIDREIEEKEGLLQDIEKVSELKLEPLRFHKEILIDANDISLRYEGAKEDLFSKLRFQVKRSERTILSGDNGCGKSSVLKAVLGRIGNAKHKADSGVSVLGEHQVNSGLSISGDNQVSSGLSVSGDFNVASGLSVSGDNQVSSGLFVSGELYVASGITVSYVSQDTSFLSGSLQKFCETRGLNESLFLAVLRQLDFDREQFAKNMEDYSEGQKKKVLIAASLVTPAHLYVWDEPLNFIDVFSRMQIEKLILRYEPTMLLVEHDIRFQEKIATEVIFI